MSYQVIFEKASGSLQGSLPTVIQGSTLETITVLALYRDGSNVNLTGKTISGTATDNDGNTYDLSGAFVGANGSFTWEFSAGDVGTANTYAIVITYTDSVDEWSSDPVRFIVRPNPAATAVQNNALVGISTALSAWLSASEAGGALGTAAYIDDAPSDGTQYARKDAAWEALSAVSDVGDLTTTGLTAANYLRVAAAGGLEERTPQQIADAIEGLVEVGTSQIVHNNSLLTGLAFCFPLGESNGIRRDKVGAYELTDNATVTQGAGVQGQAALFTAANSEYLSAASIAAYQITGDTSITYWVNEINSTTHCAYSKYGGTQNEYIAQITNLVPIWAMYVGGTAYTATWSPAILAGEWRFIHMYVDNTAKIIGIQVDNATPVTTSYTGTPNASNSPLTVGNFNTVGRYLNGRLWQFSKWNRVLTALELSNLYNGGNGLMYPFS